MSVAVHNTSVQKIVFFVENVFFVEVLIASFEPIKFWVFDVRSLRGLTAGFQLVVEAHNLILIKL